MLARLHRNLILRPFEGAFKRRNTFRYWKELEESQWLSRAELERRQLESLRRLLSHAYEYCPYYRREWDRLGLNPAHVQSLADYQSWPLLTRELIRATRADLRSTAPGQKLLSKATGGSSGVPLQFDLNMESHERRVAATYRGYNWAGAAPGTKQFHLWGVRVGEMSWQTAWKDWVYDRFQRRTVRSTFGLSRESLAEYVQTLNRGRPDVIVAYTNSLYVFAQLLEERQIVPFSPQSIVVGAEKLYSFQRTLIERVFQAPVFETYGSREFMFTAGECDRHEGLHLAMENLLIEILNDDGIPVPAGQEGQVAITDLTNYGMPFIRYLNGDRAVSGCAMCSCGRGLPLVKEIVGRQLDIVETPDGRHVSGVFFPHLMKDFPAIERFQVVQESADRVEIRLVLRDGWNDASRALLDTELRKVLGPEMNISVTQVADIPLTAAGKLRVVVRKDQAHPQCVVGET